MKSKCFVFKLRPGSNDGGSNEPVMSFWAGSRAYLWIGNEAPGDGRCFATFSSNGRLRAFAKAILANVPPPPGGKP